MKVSPINNNLEMLAVKTAKKASEEKKVEEAVENLKAVQNAEEKASKIDGTEKDVVLANIDAASVNPELINNLKLFRFHSEKDYHKTGNSVGKKIDIYDTTKG